MKVKTLSFQAISKEQECICNYCGQELTVGDRVYMTLACWAPYCSKSCAQYERKTEAKKEVKS